METGVNNEAGVQLGLRLSAAPALHFFNGGGNTGSNGNETFTAHLHAALTYGVINKAAAGYLAGKRIEISEGLISSHVVVQQVQIIGEGTGQLRIQIWFGGTFNGNVVLYGRPVYDADEKAIRFTGLTYNLETGNIFLRMARSLLQQRLARELEKRSFLPLLPYFQKAEASLHSILNKEWSPDVSSEGRVEEITVEEIAVQPEHLVVNALLRGRLVVRIAVR